MRGLGVGVAEAVGVGKARVGMGVGSGEPRNRSGPTRLRTKVSTMIILNTVVRILALRLLLRLAFDCLTLSSLSVLDCGALYHAARGATMRRTAAGPHPAIDQHRHSRV